MAHWIFKSFFPLFFCFFLFFSSLPHIVYFKTQRTVVEKERRPITKLPSRNPGLAHECRSENPSPTLAIASIDSLSDLFLQRQQQGAGVDLTNNILSQWQRYVWHSLCRIHEDGFMSDTHSGGYTKIYLCLTLCRIHNDSFMSDTVGYTKTALCLTLCRLHEDSFMSNTHSVGYMTKALCLTL